MDCTAARRAILEADLAELAAGAGSELERHLRTCPACRAAATAVLEAERALRARLAKARPRGEAADAVARAAAAARRRASLRRMGAAGSLVAAAAAVILLLLPRGPVPGDSVPPARSEAPRFSVAAGPSQNVVVMHTADPKIVVVWYLPSRRGS